MRKIIFVNRYFYPDISATSQMLSGVAFGLAEKGYNIHVLTNRYTYNNDKKIIPAVETIKNVRVHRIWTSKFGRSNLFGRSIDYFSFYIFSFTKLLFLVNKNDIVIAKTDPPLISVVCFSICFLKKAKLMNWIQDLFPEVAKQLGVRIPTPIYFFIKYLRNCSLNYSSINISIGKLMAKKIEKRGY